MNNFNASFSLPIIGRYSNNSASFSVGYTKTWHTNALFPIYDNLEFTYNNAADYFEENWEIELNYINDYSRKKGFNISAIFEVPRTKVTKLHSSDERIAYAGFSDVSMNLIEGESVGVIVGSQYLQDKEGSHIIGNDGFPIVSAEKGIIADPTPDYIIKLNPSLKFKRISIDAVLEFSAGGEFWNGTSNALNYYGTSAHSGEFRNFTDTIFAGVTLAGETNTKPVTLTEDWWTQRGISGVAEDAVQNAQHLRLRQLSVTYKSKNLYNFFEYEASLWVQNILFATIHSGVDTETSLFGYQQTQPLELFNMPAVKTYGFSLLFRF